ncbi:MAG: lamin tail domain-containing protein, partial [Chlamydiia bacterium]|nr:lamin tail domain-containing protein [Chlamydiia bacterium]
DYYLLDNNNNNPEYVISHTMDLSNYTNLSLVLNLRSDGNGAKPSCLIEISDDGGSTWTAGTETITKIIAAYINYTWSIGTVNSSTVKIRWSDSNSNGRKLRINNLELTGTVSSGPNDPNTFSATVNSTTQIDLVFTTNGNGDNVVIVYDTDGTFSTPSGAPPAAGGPFAGGTVVYNGTTSPQNHSGLTANTKYYYKAWSYDGSDYSTGLTDDATTTVNTKLFISEIASTKDNDKARFVELYNAGSSTINFGEEIWYLSKKTNNGVWKETKLTGSVGPGDNFVIVKNATDYTTAYSLIGDQTSRIATNSNGDDSFYLYSGGDHDNGTLVDIYGDGTDGTGK